MAQDDNPDEGMRRGRIWPVRIKQILGAKVGDAWWNWFILKWFCYYFSDESIIYSCYWCDFTEILLLNEAKSIFIRLVFRRRNGSRSDLASWDKADITT